MRSSYNAFIKIYSSFKSKSNCSYSLNESYSGGLNFIENFNELKRTFNKVQEIIYILFKIWRYIIHLIRKGVVPLKSSPIYFKVLHVPVTAEGFHYICFSSTHTLLFFSNLEVPRTQKFWKYALAPRTHWILFLFS